MHSIAITYPAMRDLLENGTLSMRRKNKTKNAFSRSLVDLTSEEAINANAASKSMGIASFSQSEPARRMWMVTKSARTEKSTLIWT